MEKVFGEYLVKCKVLEKPAAAEEEKKEEAADPDAAEVAPEEEMPFYPYEKVTVADALVRT